MQGYAHVNHQNVRVESGKGFQLVAALELQAGEHIVWGKLSFGVNASSYPPPQYPHTVAVAALGWHDAEDTASLGVFPESGHNNGNLNLMLAGKAPRAMRARFYVTNLYPIPIFVHHIWLTAVKLDGLNFSQTGTDKVRDTPEDEDEKLRQAMINARFRQSPFTLASLLNDQ